MTRGILIDYQKNFIEDTWRIDYENLWANCLKPNLFIIRSLPFVNSLFYWIIWVIFSLHYFRPPFTKYPHNSSSPIDYIGPPLLSAITGILQYIA